VLIEMGLPITDEMVKWNSYHETDPKSFAYAPVDDETRQTLMDMEKMRDRAFKN
jgi:hypothetical protein